MTRSKWFAAATLLVGVVVASEFSRRGCAGDLPVNSLSPTPSRAPLQWSKTPGLGQAEAPARRVAGRVSFEGKPLSAATVRLEPSGLALQAALELRSDAEGLFDFGLQPPLPFTVSASSPGRTGALELIDLRDPLTRPESLVLELTALVHD